MGIDWTETLLPAAQAARKKFAQWSITMGIVTKLRLEQAEIRPPPQPFRPIKPGEPSQIFRCAHLACEGNGTFEVSQAQLDWFAKKNISMPKNCFACRQWIYPHNCAGEVVGTCGKCTKPVTVTARQWIGRHKFQGAPEFGMYCTNCKRRAAHLAAYPTVYPATKTGLLTRITNDPGHYKKLKVGTKKKRLINFALAHQRLLASQPVLIDPWLLVDISTLTDKPDTHFYHTNMTQGVAGQPQSRYQHIEQHFDGSKDTSLAFFEGVADVIKYAHEAIASHDFSNLISLRQGASIIKIDTDSGIKYVFNQLPNGRYYLVTAYQKETAIPDPTTSQRQEITTELVLETLQDPRTT